MKCNYCPGEALGEKSACGECLERRRIVSAEARQAKVAAHAEAKRAADAAVDVSLLSPREREAWDYRLAGKTAAQAAAAMGCKKSNVEMLWVYARRRRKRSRSRDLQNEGQEMVFVGRCHCGLLLPCYHRPNWDMAMDRRAE